MQHRDIVCINKIIDEMNIGVSLLGDSGLKEFLKNMLNHEN